MSLFLQRIHKTVVYHENDVFHRYFKGLCIFNDYVYTIPCGIPIPAIYITAIILLCEEVFINYWFRCHLLTSIGILDTRISQFNNSISHRLIRCNARYYT